MKEDFLHYLWRYKRVPLHCELTSGERLEIRCFGTYNRLAGPDFTGAQLVIGEQLWAGCVEMHLKSSDWYLHGHEYDTAYNNVILHIVWEHDIEVFDVNNVPIPTLELRNWVTEELLSTYRESLAGGYKFITCERLYNTVPAITLLSWNERLLVERLEEKATLVRQLWIDCQYDWEKVLFMCLLKHFGGTVNGEVFMQLGRGVPFSVIRKERVHPLRLEALLLGLAGLLPEETEWQYVTKLYEDFVYLKQKYSLELLPLRMNFKGLRPQGFPTIRLAQLAQVYESKEGLFSQLIEVNSFKDLKTLFKVKLSEFWETHYTFGKVSKKVRKPLSDSFIALIWVNVLIPLKYLYYKTQGRDVSEELMEVMKLLPADNNGVIDAFKNLGAEMKCAFDSQVLLHQYKYYCQRKRCLDCAVGVALLGKS